jgi:CheY-like chemotaxis protein
MKKNKKQKTILLIEDEQNLLDVVKAKLEKNDYLVVTSRSVVRAFGLPIIANKKGEVDESSVIEALKHIEKLEQVDAIWLDHNLLGNEDGLDFVTKFKANGGRWSKVPIFVISNSSNPDLVKTYAKLGVNKYYIKAEHKLENIIGDMNMLLNK